MSSILALESSSNVPLTEDMKPNPDSIYARSKYDAELFILQQIVPPEKRFYIIRTPLVYGLGNKGNFKILFDFIQQVPFWPLGFYNSKRSFCDINNLLFVMNRLIDGKNIESGIYHVADNQTYTLKQLYFSVCTVLDVKPHIWYIPKFIVYFICMLGSIFKFPINLKRLTKLTNTLIVSNSKIKSSLGHDLPYGGKKGLLNSFNYFKHNNS
jgi:nucleoside-diphosphate-sugar epimerase